MDTLGGHCKSVSDTQRRERVQKVVGCGCVFARCCVYVSPVTCNELNELVCVCSVDSNLLFHPSQGVASLK